MTDPTPEPRPQVTARDRVGLAGFACLGVVAAVGGLGGAVLAFLGVGAYARAATAPLTRAEDAAPLLGTLERAVVLCGAGALLLLVGVVAAVVLVKELSDDANRAHRGPV
ncbi:MAG: hypothetical protein M9894_18440 [Planctomycetes bacterium]|nr:hypothetical protein [Planctomycetota bacterium]